MRPRIVALLALGIVAASVSAPLIRLADAPPLAIAFWRNAIGAAVLLSLSFARRRDEVRALGRRDIGGLLVAGVFLAAHFAAFVPAVTMTTVAAATVLGNTQPVWAALGARLVFGDRVPPRVLAGIAVALVGAALISGGDFGTSRRAFLGDVFAVVGAIAVAGYFLAGKALRSRLSVVVYAAFVYAVCAMVLLVVVVATATPLFGFDAETWLWLGLMALGPQIIGHTTFNYLLQDLDATSVGIAVMAEPVGASLLAFALFGEVPTALAVLGGVVIVGGIIVAITAESRRQLVAPVE